MGAGVNLFKTLFSEDFYPYTANTLMSAKPTSKVIKDSNNQTIQTITLSGVELRGLIKVGTNGLYADGDIDDGSGTGEIRYEERAYQAGDESLANAITDGTNTVVKLATPTTQTLTAWNNPIKAKEGGTEEFTDTRAIKMPTGHDTVYADNLSYHKDTFAQIFGGDYDAVSGILTSRYNSDGSTKATPDKIQLTPEAIIALVGMNKVWHDDGNTEVKYIDIKGAET